VHIERVTDPSAVRAADHLFDAPSDPTATRSFLNSPDHHLLLAYDEGGDAIGMVSGVETTHPDKGSEMFLYELAVADSVRRQGVASALIGALRSLAVERGCYGMWVAVDQDNDPALATYRKSMPSEEDTAVVFTWTLPTSPSA
jgi:ribosomal protein S18 acetylase RimI-like enzyme